MPNPQAIPEAAARHGIDARLAHPTTSDDRTQMRARSELTVVGSSQNVVPALARRLRRRESRLLVWVDEPTPGWRLLRRLALRVADGVLAGSDAAAADATTRRGSGETVFAVPGPFEIAAFLAVASTRRGAAAHRVIVREALTPDGDGLHILYSAVRWADQNPQRRLELVWVGDGDLREVLRAQSLPENLRQHFAGVTGAAELAQLYADAGVLIGAAPTRRPTSAMVAKESAVLAEAMASGLVVLFDFGCRAAGRLLRDGQSGIGYDGAAPDGLERALTVVMARPAAALNTMRGAARMRVLPMDPQGFAERLDRAITTVMRGGRGGGASPAGRPAEAG